MRAILDYIVSLRAACNLVSKQNKTKQNKIMYIKKRIKNDLIWFVLEVDSNDGTLYTFDPST